MTAPKTTAPKTSKTVTLCDPIDWEGERITEVTVSKPKVKHLRCIQAAMDASPDRMDQGVAMAVAMTGLAEDIIDELDIDDFNAISEVIADFFPAGHGVSGWRSVVAETAHWLNTPLSGFDEMDWAEVVLWHAEARRIARAAQNR